MFKGIDLSSDTASKPTLAMKQAMLAAEVGDEQKGEDPSTHQLETMVADLLGLDKALFFPSATMANQIALCLLCEPGEEVIAAENAHIFTSESGGPAIHAGVITKSINTQTGMFTAEDLHHAYNSRKSLRSPVSKCVVIENTTNLAGGLAWDLDNLKSVLSTAKELNLRTHLDGARLLNAAVKHNVSPKQLAEHFDTVTICLSKGLGCPVGALLALPAKYYDKALRLKHLFGGAMRQSGFLAAAGIYALEHHIKRLAEDHQHAALFAQRLQTEVGNVQVETHPAATNMVFFSWHGKQHSPADFYALCIEQGVRFSQITENRFRAVFHLDIDRDDVDKTISILKTI